MSRSKQSLSHYNLTTCDMGQLIPIGWYPVLPGDVIGQKTNVLLRVSPLAAPVMHQVDVRVHHFKVAYRTIWDGWEDFITGGEDGMNQAVIPTNASTAIPNSLQDYLGVPRVDGVPISSLPTRAFNQIFNEFYRDQDLVPERLESDITIPQVAWGKDYYTSARPFSAKGPSVSIPVGDSAPIKGIGAENKNYVVGPTSMHETGGTVPRDYANYKNIDNSAPDSTIRIEEDPDNLGFPSIYADLSNAEGADPLDVRRAWGIQRFMENAARFGSRYPEKMRQLGSLYKGLMDRPEFLAGGNKSINFSEVLQTAPDEVEGGSPHEFGVGDLYGHGIAAMRSNKYARRVDEHGLIMTLLSVRPRSIYQDGVHREWLRKDREDFHDPYLEFIGQQEIQLNELFLDAANDENTVFGFSDKYEEYRGHPSTVSAEFRDTLDYWHMARKFDTAPVLNQTFTDCVPTKRIHNEQTQHSCWVMAHHSIAAHRNVSKSATPRLI